MARTMLSPARLGGFQKRVYGHFEKHGREFPWRKTRDPYHVFIAEVMLQQTQASRVAAKFEQFIGAFKGFDALARAPLRKVLCLWQGMGYNRRALYLRAAAREIVRRFGGCLPASIDELETLPGIGPATARSIAVYAFNRPVVFIETNIRAVFIHEFFADKGPVSDGEIEPLVEQTLDRKDPWKWYNALMDYGVMLKERHGNPTRRSSHYVRQSPFADSDRRIRGEILRHASGAGPVSEQVLGRSIAFPQERIRRCLQSLIKDGLLSKKGRTYFVP